MQPSRTSFLGQKLPLLSGSSQGKFSSCKSLFFSPSGGGGLFLLISFCFNLYPASNRNSKTSKICPGESKWSGLTLGSLKDGKMVFIHQSQISVWYFDISGTSRNFMVKVGFESGLKCLQTLRFGKEIKLWVLISFWHGDFSVWTTLAFLLLPASLKGTWVLML